MNRLHRWAVAICTAMLIIALGNGQTKAAIVAIPLERGARFNLSCSLIPTGGVYVVANLGTPSSDNIRRGEVTFTTSGGFERVMPPVSYAGRPPYEITTSFLSLPERITASGTFFGFSESGNPLTYTIPSGASVGCT